MGLILVTLLEACALLFLHYIYDVDDTIWFDIVWWWTVGSDVVVILHPSPSRPLHSPPYSRHFLHIYYLYTFIRWLYIWIYSVICLLFSVNAFIVDYLVTILPLHYLHLLFIRRCCCCCILFVVIRCIWPRLRVFLMTFVVPHIDAVFLLLLMLMFDILCCLHIPYVLPHCWFSPFPCCIPFDTLFDCSLHCCIC